MATGRENNGEFLTDGAVWPLPYASGKEAELLRDMVIFFEIDDTLVDQRRAEMVAAQQVLAFYGHWLKRPYSAREFCHQWRYLRDKHNRAFFAGKISLREQRRRRAREFFPAKERSLSDLEADLFFDFYEHHYRSGWSLFDDVLPFFQSLSGSRFGVISNGSTAQQKCKLEQTGIARYDVIVVSEEIGAAKPDRNIFLAACERARYPAQRCVGDRFDEDALASRSAGMRSFWLIQRTDGFDAAVGPRLPSVELRSYLQDGREL